MNEENNNKMNDQNNTKPKIDIKTIKGLVLIIIGLALIIFSSKILLYTASFFAGVVIVHQGLKMLRIKQISSLTDRFSYLFNKFFN